MLDVYKNIEYYSSSGKCNALITSNDAIADVINNKKHSPLVTEMFIRGRKLNISFVFIKQYYFQVRKDVRLTRKHFHFMKIRSKWKFQQIAFNHLPDIRFEDVLNLYKMYNKTRPFLVIGTTLASYYLLLFRRNPLKWI